MNLKADWIFEENQKDAIRRQIALNLEWELKFDCNIEMMMLLA